MITFTPPAYVFIVDFYTTASMCERDLCNYLMGVSRGLDGEDSEGERVLFVEAVAEISFSQRNWFLEHVVYVPESNGRNYCSGIWLTEGLFRDCMNNIWVDNADPDEVRKKYIESSVEYYAAMTRQLMDRPNAKTSQFAAHEIGRYKKKVAEAKETTPKRYPVYSSIAFFFDEALPPEIIELLKARTVKFTQKEDEFPKNGRILGYRLIKQTLLQETQAL